MTTVIDINPDQAEAIRDSNLLAAQSIASAAQMVAGDQFVFLAAFDGTNNDRDNNLAPGAQCTNVRQLV